MPHDNQSKETASQFELLSCVVTIDWAAQSIVTTQLNHSNCEAVTLQNMDRLCADRACPPSPTSNDQALTQNIFCNLLGES
eukprot:3132524-Amphidinium_carterae.1